MDIPHLPSHPGQAEARVQGPEEQSPRKGKSIMLGLARGMAGQAELGKTLNILGQEVRAGDSGKEREETKSPST